MNGWILKDDIEDQELDASQGIVTYATLDRLCGRGDTPRENLLRTRWRLLDSVLHFTRENGCAYTGAIAEALIALNPTNTK